jgi:hypothetical protein
MKRIISSLALLAFTGCATPVYVTNWKQVELGMTHDQVRGLLGEPHASSAPMEPKIKATLTLDGTNVPPEIVEQGAKLFFGALFDRNYERWIYGQDALLGPPAKAFAVYFDDQGKVIGYRRPTKGRFRNLPKEDNQPTSGSSIFPDSRANQENAEP